MDTLFSYLLFLAETITLVAAILVIVWGVVALIQKTKKQPEGEIEITSLNDRLDVMNETLREMIFSKKQFKQWCKEYEQHKKEEEKNIERPKIFVLTFDGDLKASEVDSLRQVITAVLMVATKNDKIFLSLESAGGMIHAYGLAASQLKRIKDKGIPLVVSIDKVAASGGYLMAAVADTILAAPFAVVGSIGVLAQLPNFYRALKHHHVDFEQLTAGEYKRTLSLFGKNTEEGRKKLQEEIEEAHRLFKQFVHEHRPHLEIDKIATGEHWYGQKALELHLIDEIQTSDDYLLAASEHSELYKVEYTIKKAWTDKLSSLIKATFFKSRVEKQLAQLTTIPTHVDASLRWHDTF